MARHSDQSLAATEIRAAQARRLRRLRSIVQPVQIDAARPAGVSAFSWNRMEKNEAEISAVALARWAQAHDLPTEYVLTGRLDGLKDPLIRLILAAEAEEEAAPAEPVSLAPARRSGAPPDSAAPASRPRARIRAQPLRIGRTDTAHLRDG